MPTKILLVYASAGTGHKKAAEAIHDSLANKTGVQATLIDALDYARPAFKKLYSKGYEFLVRKARFIWAVLYDSTDIKPVTKVNIRLSSLITKLNTRKLLNHINTEEPDIIIATHFIISELAKKIKKSLPKNPRIICVVTDFCIHSLWESKYIDNYIVPTAESKTRLIKYGIPQERIKIIGIPVAEKFYEKKDRSEICNKLGLDPHKFTGLIVTGSVGIGPIEKITKTLKDEIQLLVICAKNQKLYLKLKETAASDSCKIFQLVDNMDELMYASDIIITKPGGLTIAESLAINLPMIFIAAIPGQESKNAKTMQNYGVGFRVRTISRLKAKVLEFKNNPSELSQIKERIRSLNFNNVTARLIDEICSYCN